jgi:hypothetical protein
MIRSSKGSQCQRKQVIISFPFILSLTVIGFCELTLCCFVGDPQVMNDADITLPKEEYGGFEKPGRCLVTSVNEKWMACGSGDGVLTVIFSVLIG